MKLNGWRRLGLVASCVWFFGVVSLAAYDAITHRDGFFVGLTLPAGTVASGNEAKLPDGRTVKLNFALEGKKVKPWEIKWDNEPEVPTETIVHWAKLTFGLALPLLVWFFVELLVGIGAWISRGFREQKAP